MATRGVIVSLSKSNSKILNRGFSSLKNDIKKEQYNRKQWKSTSATVVGTETTDETEKFQKDELDLTFENTKSAYKSKTTWELIRALTVLKLSTIDYLVENNQKVSSYFQNKNETIYVFVAILVIDFSVCYVFQLW